MFYHGMKVRDFFIKELDREKTKRDITFRAKANQNQDEKPVF